MLAEVLPAFEPAIEPTEALSEKMKRELTALFKITIGNVPAADIESSGHFIVRGNVPFEQKKLLADANSELANWLEQTYRDFLHGLEDDPRSEMAAAFTEKYHGDKIALLRENAGMPDLKELFGNINGGTKPELRLV